MTRPPTLVRSRTPRLSHAYIVNFETPPSFLAAASTEYLLFDPAEVYRFLAEAK